MNPIARTMRDAVSGIDAQYRRCWVPLGACVAGAVMILVAHAAAQSSSGQLTPAFVKRLSGEEIVTTSFSQDSGHVAVGSLTGKAIVYDCSTGHVVVEVDNAGVPVSGVFMIPARHELACALAVRLESWRVSRDPPHMTLMPFQMNIYDVRAPSTFRKVPGEFARVAAAASGTAVVRVRSSGVCERWDGAVTQCLMHMPVGEYDATTLLSLSPTGRFVAVQDTTQRAVRVYDLEEARLVTTLGPLDGKAWSDIVMPTDDTAIAVHPTGRVQQFSLNDGTVVYDRNTGNRVHSVLAVETVSLACILIGDGVVVECWSLSANEKKWAFPSDKDDKRVVIWRASTDAGRVALVVSDPEGEDKVLLLDAVSGRVAEDLGTPRGRIVDVVWSPNGKRLAAVSVPHKEIEARLQLWNLRP